MKKKFMIVFAALLMILITACGANTSAFKRNASGTSLNCEGDGWSIQTKGDQLILKVDADHSTGYNWVVDDSGSEMFHIENNEYFEYEDDGEDTGGIEKFTINVLQSGTGGLTFEYKQDWNGGKSAGKYDMNITAQDNNGDIVITDANFTPMS